MRIAASLMVALACGAAFAAAQNCITYETRPKTPGLPRVEPFDTPDSVRSKFMALSPAFYGSGYCPVTGTSMLVNFENSESCAPGGQDELIGYRFVFEFSTVVPINITVLHGPDYGFGGFLRLDNHADLRADDLWASGDFGNLGETLHVDVLNLPPGQHVIESVGFEECCDGSHVFRVVVNGGDPLAFTCGMLERVGVPVFVGNSPSVVSTTFSTATIYVATDIPATAHCKLYPAAAPLIAPCNVYVMHRPIGAHYASFRTDASGASYTFTNLPCGTAFTLYCGAVSDQGVYIHDQDVLESAEPVLTTSLGCFRVECPGGHCAGAAVSSVEASSEGHAVHLEFGALPPFNAQRSC